MILGFILGLPIGALLMYRAVEERKENERLREVIEDLNEDIDKLGFKNKLKDEKINDLQKEQVTLLENASELRAEKVDLENNLELIKNSLPDKIKELISDDQSEN